jgi:hypothetical protein
MPANAVTVIGEGEGDTAATPTVDPNEVMAMVHAPLEKALNGAGITPDYLASRLREELDAHETKIFFDQRTGNLLYSKDLVSWKVRSEARKDAHKLLGHYPPERRELTGPAGVPLDLRMGPEVQQVIQEIEILVLGDSAIASMDETDGEVVDV